MLPENIRFAIGERIRKERLKTHLSQLAFSESIDISTNFLSEIETGKKGFSAETLYNICKVHNISSDYILFGPPEEKNSYDKLIEITSTMSNHELNISIDYLSALLKMKEAQNRD